MQYGVGPTDIYSAYLAQQQQQQPLPFGQQAQPQPAQIQPGLPTQKPVMAQPQELDPSTVNAFLAVQQGGQKSQDAARSRALAKQLRGDAQGQLKGVDTGKFYVGPTWANMLANVAQQYRARQEESSATEKEADVQRDKEKATRELIQALTNSRGSYASS